MKTKFLVTGLAMLLATSATAATPKAKALAQIPPTVRQAAESLVGDGKLLDLERTIENGHTVFEGEFRRDGVVRSFTLAPDGMLISKQLFEKELPPSVAQTLRAQLGEAKLGDIYWTNDDGDPAFYVELTRRDMKRSLTIAPDGWLAAREVTLADMPGPARQAITPELKGATPTRIERGDDGHEVTFDVTIEVAKRTRSLIFAEDGKLLAAEVSWLDVPPPAQLTIQKRQAGGRLVVVFKWEDDGEAYFEATFVRGSHKRTCTTQADGTLVSAQLPLAEAPAPVQKAVHDRNAFVVRLEQHFDDGDAYFEAVLRVRGKPLRLEIKPDGTPN